LSVAEYSDEGKVKLKNSTFGINKAGQWLALNIRYYEIKN